MQKLQAKMWQQSQLRKLRQRKLLPRNQNLIRKLMQNLQLN
jgi:hypothetical protein